ncbi:MAG: UDP-N-acetylmuramate dehydrogenase [Acidimicrobiales bacterium]
MRGASSVACAREAFARSSRALRVESDRAIGSFTTYRVGGTADLFVTCEAPADLDEVARVVALSGIDVLVIGNGSNLLVADGGFRGIAIVLGGRFEFIGLIGNELRAGGATRLPVAARRSAAAGLAGFEWAVGVPGTIGGAVRMNAGGHGSDIARTLVSADIVDLRHATHTTRPAGQLDLRYRHSNLTPTDVVVEARFALTHGDPIRSEAEIAEIVRWRRENQPGGQNAGSVFTNPPGDSAGRLIDTAGCKGLRIGTARVSGKHANFFIADDGGAADDVFALMREVRGRVREVHGIELTAETQLVGFPEGL